MSGSCLSGAGWGVDDGGCDPPHTHTLQGRRIGCNIRNGNPRSHPPGPRLSQSLCKLTILLRGLQISPNYHGKQQTISVSKDLEESVALPSDHQHLLNTVQRAIVFEGLFFFFVIIHGVILIMG